MSNDLRSRVVAVRLLNDGIDPYFFKWTTGVPEEYLDPRDFPSRSVSRVTVPPTVLVLQGIFADSNYKVQKYLSVLLQWLALVVSIILLTKDIKGKKKRMVLTLIILASISSTWFWRFHVDAGQLYIMYVMLFAISYYAMKTHNKSGHLISGLILGILVSLRPNAIVFFIPVIVLKRTRIIVGAILGFFINIMISFAIWGISPWISYYRAIKIHGEIHLGLLDVDLIPNSIVYGLNEVEGVIRFDDVPRFLYTDSSLQFLIGLSSKDLVIALAAILCIYMYVLFINRKSIITIECIYLLGISAVIISEFFIPAARLSYYDVIWIIPLCLMFVLDIDYNEKVFIIVLILIGVFTLSLAENYFICGVSGPYIALMATIYATTIYTRGFLRQKLLRKSII